MKTSIRLLLFLLLAGAAAAQSGTPAPDAGVWQGPAVAAPPDPQRPGPAPKPAIRRGPDMGNWWKNSKIVQEIQLSPAQINQIEQTFLEHRLKLIDLRADVERNEAKLQPLIEADQPDEAKVGAQLDLLLAARGRLEKANAMMMLSIRKILSVEQWKKLEAIKQGREVEDIRWKVAPPPGGETRRRQPMPAPPPIDNELS
jgi:Spy/CpxP family protein refolding chaperone